MLIGIPPKITRYGVNERFANYNVAERLPDEISEGFFGYTFHQAYLKVWWGDQISPVFSGETTIGQLEHILRQDNRINGPYAGDWHFEVEIQDDDSLTICGIFKINRKGVLLYQHEGTFVSLSSMGEMGRYVNQIVEIQAYSRHWWETQTKGK